MPAPACCVFIATSVDGFIARTDGGIDWLKRVEREGEDYGYQRFFDSVDALVIGRGTYEVVRGFDAWPYGGKRCVVLTHRTFEPKAKEEFFEGEPRALLDKLGAEGLKRVYVDGGAVISQFLAAGLIDQLTISQVPVLLGRGLPLFHPGTEHALTLVESRSFPSGLVQSTWHKDQRGASGASGDRPLTPALSPLRRRERETG
ncbi:MAG: dihydrofolate reductase family protein [Archangium sp.]|nr:dihydrofolate reductase family protein [Archangium sp.]